MDTITRHIPEDIILDKRLGRHVNHDPRSKQYRVPRLAGTIQSVIHTRRTPILDQGNLGSCTGNASVGVLGTDPFYTTMPKDQDLSEAEAIRVYSLGTQLDQFSGQYPPDDTGSDGLSVAKACQQLGLISGYTHALSMDDFLHGMQTAPAIVGTNWLTGMDTPDASGLVRYSGSVRGGHEYEAFGIDVDAELVWFYNSWGTSYGLTGRFCMTFADFEKALADDGDATFFVPITQPAPTPTPVPGAAPFLGALPAVATHIASASARAKMSQIDWLNHHFTGYFKL